MKAMRAIIDRSSRRKALELAAELGCTWDDAHQILDAPRGWTFFGAHCVSIQDHEWAGALLSLRHIRENGFQPCGYRAADGRGCDVCGARPSPLRLVKG